MEPTVLRHNRWRCDHGWDVDLDDGSSNFIITDNLMLNGGLKLREGYRRIVTNNIMVNNTLHPHVWYPESGDVFTGNIVMAAYKPALMSATDKWGKEIDRNLFASSHMDRLRFAANGADANSIVGDPRFADPARGDFMVKNESLARQIGFRNFLMDEFGVRKPSLKAIAEKPEMPKVNLKIDTRVVTPEQAAPPVDWMGVKLRHPSCEEMSAYGVSFDTKGLAVRAVDRNSALGGPGGLQQSDLILALNGNPITSVADLRKVLESVKDGRLQLRIIREQKETTLDLTLNNLKKPL